MFLLFINIEKKKIVINLILIFILKFINYFNLIQISKSKNEEITIKTEPVDPVPSSKRKRDQVSNDEQISEGSSFVLLNETSLPADGVKVKKNKKIKISDEEKKIMLEQEQVNYITISTPTFCNFF